MRNKIDLAEFVNERAWELPKYYYGQTYEGYVVVLGYHRDSHLVDQSNFHVTHETLKAAHKKQEGQENFDEDDLTIAAASHWAVGWCQTIMVRATNTELVREAAEICRSIEDYPVLDDSDYQDREMTERDETISDFLSLWMKEIGEALAPNKDQESLTPEQSDDLESLCVFLFHEDCSYSGIEDAWARLDCGVSVWSLDDRFKGRYGYFSKILKKRLKAEELKRQKRA